MIQPLIVLILMLSITIFSVSAATPALSDGQIAKILITINDGEIEAGQMAKYRAQNKEVQDFAKSMVQDHRANLNDTKKVAKENKINAQDSEVSKTLQSEAKNSNQDLKNKDKTSFDKAYLQQEIEMHDKALTTLNDSLIPNATDPEFKTHLERTRDAVATHLEHVRGLDSKIR